MLELQAHGSEPDQRWRTPLAEGVAVRLGRGLEGGLSIPWDARISREHAILEPDGDVLHVQRVESARNRIFFRNRASDAFTLRPGEEFRIGRTTFRLVRPRDEPRGDHPSHRATFSLADLDAVAFGNADERLEILARLPDQITACTDDTDFAHRIARLLLEAIPAAEGAAVVRWGSEVAGEPNAICNVPREPGAHFRPSRRLMAETLERGETVAHTWNEEGEDSFDDRDSDFTYSGDMDWAFCVPILGEACEGWCLYLSGRTTRGPGPTAAMLGDMRFVQLVAQFVGAIGRVLQLEKQRAGMARFFSPVVVESMKREMRHVSFANRDDPETNRLLVPREGNITVLFCDLRGFSRESERSDHDLRGLMERVSEALGLMSTSIIRHGGVIADFIGDAALGFWGWPDAVDDGPLRAARAALDIVRDFHNRIASGNAALADFHVGIGIAHGLAIAGRIGTLDQAKVDVFGPVVNVGSRLEGMTKQFRAQILVDETTANFLRDRLPRTDGRLRRLARVRPAGMERPVMVTELLPAEGAIDRHVTDAAIRDYERALELFTAGHWADALDTLDGLPVEDRVKHFLMVHIAQCGYVPPEGWDGVITLSRK